MTVDAAFQLLQLDETATLRDLSLSFRRLLKEYHPDRNGDRREWSHRMTVELNRAYEVVASHLRELEDQDRRDWGDIAEEVNREASDSGYSLVFQTRLATLYDALLDAVFTYYNFGLDNVHLRGEGTLRYRYRGAVKRLKEALTGFDELKEWPGSELQHGQAEIVRVFAAGFYENMLAKGQNRQGLYGQEQKAYRYFREAAEDLDGAIKGHLFGDQLAGATRSPEAISSCEANLLSILANFPKSRWVPETLIKLYLLQSFVALCREVLYVES